MSALARLSQDYLSSSSEDDEETEIKRKSVSSHSKMNAKKICISPDSSSKTVAVEITTQKHQLPVPGELLAMFNSSEPDDNDLENPDKHEGRLRSFPHERGNWATHVYISSTADEFFDELVDRLLSKCDDFKPAKEFHISLSKTVVLKYHWINLFTSSLKKKIESFRKSVVIFDTVALYTNEEKSRTFLSLKVNSDDFLNRLTEKVNETLAEFDLPTFYEESSFHITVGWCVGNKIQQLNETLPKLQELFITFCQDEAQRWPSINVNEIWCKTGNKIFSFPLL